jgi:hypothetical protein
MSKPPENSLAAHWERRAKQEQEEANQKLLSRVHGLSAEIREQLRNSSED